MKAAARSHYGWSGGSVVKRLEGRHAVVTGAGRGIGRAIAAGLAEEGALVTLVARSREPLEDLASEIQTNGGSASVVNAAGVFGPMQLIAESDVEQWLDTIRTNQFSVYLMCRRYVPGMIGQGWGRVLNVTSAASLHCPGPVSYTH